MDAQDLQGPEKIVNMMNNAKSSMTGMKPKDAIKLDSARLDQTFPGENVLPEDDLNECLHPPREQHDDQKIEATDSIWSIITYRLGRVIEEPGNRVLHYFQGGPDREFVREELMRIPNDTKVPPEWVSK